ncbi:Uncharacterized conserved protein [Plasmopara halstedii]|uniref:Uncharacterized conserved protein n=1 Tax=Plasmopara halstedii TaxID=4781 RepID=A0A0P1AVD6_PLAHL|nr:Uncharacterized conserved protein [Plasmopara halstedii]CEG45286.1 Uncharacterized conserved protein [Plasmopara halstedii]|eukprot:XP_024581655.1 Uncharacterized conserved protein [Plasmopara halstedii]
MGNDGGVIAVKRKFMRHANVKSRGEQAEQEVLRLEKSRTCALSSEQLREPVVACRLGNLFNKQALLENLLAKSIPERFCHITSIKDVVTCRVMYDKEEENALWCCPVTMIEFNGKQPFAVIFTCGCVLSERALKTISTEECLVCGKTFGKQDIVMLSLNDEHYEAKQKKLLEVKAAEKRGKKNNKPTQEKYKEYGDHEHTKTQEGKKRRRIAKKLSETKDVRLVKIAEDASKSIYEAKEKSQVFASLFTKSKNKKASANDLLMTVGGMRYTLS